MNPPRRLHDDVWLTHEVVTRLRESGVTDDDPDFLEILENESDLLERLRRMVRASREQKTYAKALGEMIADMRERKARLELRAEQIDSVVLWALQESGVRRLDAPDFTASVASGKPPLMIAVDPKDLPNRYCRVTREPSKSRLREDLETGIEVEGVTLGNPVPYLTVRTK
jgi:hypothetical protein